MSIELGTVDTFVDLTPAAKKEIREQLQKHKDPNAGVRIHVIIDRYSGYVFDLAFDTPNPEKDHQITIDGIPVFTHKSFMEYVKGMKIDFDPDVPAFSLNNDNPSYNCVPGAKFECPTCNLYEERKDDPKYNPELSEQ